MELNGKERREHSNAVTSFNRDRDEKDDIEKEKNNKYNSSRRHKTLFIEERFETNAVLLPSQKRKVVQWRMKDRIKNADQMKTVSVALAMCLNIGVDPPDVIKTTPCARLECWVDPTSMPAPKALDTIGKTLQMQYERWQPRAKYKLCLDPTVEDVKRLCVGLRRNAKEERVLFHYNGHGVPKPTNNGELWVFNKNFTQYIPCSIYELQSWLGTPSIYVFDSSAAGLIVKWFNKFIDQRQGEYERNAKVQVNPQAVKQLRDYILLAACGTNETLPTNPELPADIFTACLTTPIKIALRWFCSQTIINGVKAELVDKIPGRLNDRRTPLGELNWIFTAITDTIAWNTLPKPLFQKLFRQDLLVASLFRNFLLAERIMRSCKCTPISYPKLPPTYNHPMWQAWDLAADQCLSQLSKLISDPSYEFKHSTFFTEQLTAFEVWLEFGTEEKKPPEQLPIVLQVLLSQQHRLRALVLLGKFLDLGYWAVNQALSVGIFPYVLKLLQSPAVELREILVFIWAKILALDKIRRANSAQSCQLDLIKDGGQHYFINVLGNTKVPAPQRTQAAFILSVISNNCRPGQQACLNARMLQICLGQLSEQDSMLRRWVVFALAKFWENYEEAKWAAIKDGAHEKLCSLLQDPVPEVRAAAVYALGTFIGGGHSPEPSSTQMGQPGQPGLPQGPPSVPSQPSNPSAPGNAPQAISSHRTSGGASSGPAFGSASRARSEQRTSIELNLAVTLPVVTTDSSPMVRKELIIAFAHLIQAYEEEFKTLIKTIQRKEQAKAALDKKKEADKKKVKPGAVKGAPNQPPSPEAEESPNSSSEQSSIYEFVWDHLWNLTTDPYPELARVAIALVNKVKSQAGDTALLPMPPVDAPRRMSEDLQASPAGKSPRPGAKKIQHKKVPSFSNLLLLKKQPSMNDLRSSGGIPATPGTPKSASLHHDDDSRDDDNDNSEDLRSTLYEWSCNYFSLPLMTTKEEDETSPQYSEKRWRQQRIEHLKKEALSLNDKAFQILGCRKLENEIAILENDNEMVSLLAFHPFENIIVVGDEKDGISVWNWEEGGKINLFSNCNPPGTRLTALSLLNEHDYPLIATGSDDGVVRIWSGIYEPESVKLVTAWRVLLGLAPLTKGTGAGLIVDWQQQNELMIASGNVGSIRIWDVNKELKIQDISTACEAFVTALASDKSGGSVIAAGCADGSVRLFDRRTSSKFGPVATFSEHKGWIVSVSMPKSINQIISGSTSGEIKFWDPAKSSSVRTITAHSGTVMTSCTVHDQAPLIATGSQDQRIKVMNFNSEELSLIRYHDGFLGQRIGPVSSLSFHPFQILLAAGATDSIVSIYAGETFKTTPSP